MLKILKSSFLFIATIIGAGFATGREISEYFSQTSLLTVVIAGILIGLLSIVFMLYGKFRTPNRFSKANKFFDLIIAMASFLTFFAMVAGAETLFQDIFNVKLLGLFSGLIISGLSLCKLDKIKAINFPIVLLIIILVIRLGASNTSGVLNVQFSFVKAMSYSALNMLLAGYIIADDGKSMTNKEIVATGLTTAFFLSLMLALIWKLTLNYSASQMPLLDFAKANNLSGSCATVIYFAIASTMLSSGKVLADYIEHMRVSKYVALGLLCCSALISYKLDFKNFVSTVYPIISVVGISYIIFVIVNLILIGKNKLCIKKYKEKNAPIT